MTYFRLGALDTVRDVLDKALSRWLPSARDRIARRSAAEMLSGLGITEVPQHVIPLWFSLAMRNATRVRRFEGSPWRNSEMGEGGRDVLFVDERGLYLIVYPGCSIMYGPSYIGDGIDRRFMQFDVPAELLESIAALPKREEMRHWLLGHDPRKPMKVKGKARRVEIKPACVQPGEGILRI